LVLRHRPEKIGLQLDPNGWTSVTDLLEKMTAHGVTIDLPLLKKLVESSDKQRFAFSADGSKIRANQGHSVKVDLGLAPAQPPGALFHGTAAQHLISIKKNGLDKGRRHHVHLSPDRETAYKVGSRHGKAVVLTVLAGEMQRAGHVFYKTENGVWLVDAVPAEFIEFPTIAG
jgi:putative RNA 2'-phosphotransferase